MNKAQSSPAGWSVSHGEPWGPVLPCSGLPAQCSGVCWCLLCLVELLRWGVCTERRMVLWLNETSGESSISEQHPKPQSHSRWVRGAWGRVVFALSHDSNLSQGWGQHSQASMDCWRACPELCSFWGGINSAAAHKRRGTHGSSLIGSTQTSPKPTEK